MGWFDTLGFLAFAAFVWFYVLDPLADLMADRDVKGWGRRDD